MYSLLIIVIYTAFVSLGLPDALLGSAWPVMQTQFNVPVHYAGIISMTIAAGTIVSSLLSDWLTRKMNVGLVTALSVCMTAAALFGFSVSDSFLLLCVWAVPYGLGAGAVDAAINNYVAVHYTARHMNWLHCFWGVGAMAGPYVMGFYLARGLSWNNSYGALFVIQAVFAAVLFISLPLWKKRGNEPADKPLHEKGFIRIFRIKGVKQVLTAFFAYCALESTAGLWASTYLVKQRGVGIETAALFASFFFLGITAGRFFTGLMANRLGDKTMIKMGIAVIIIGITAAGLPVDNVGFCLAGLVIIGLGCAPVYPSIIHSTPEHFGVENSQAIVGLQMASAYTGATLMPPLFGWMANAAGLFIYPIFLLVFALLMLIMTSALNRIIGKRDKN